MVLLSLQASKCIPDVPKTELDLYRRLVQFLKENLGQVAGPLSGGQASCMSLAVFNKKILKKGT